MNARDILPRFAYPDKDTSDVVRIGNGSINETWGIVQSSSNTPSFVLQKMHPLFSPSVMEDIFHVTSHLKQKGIRTQEIVSAQNGEFYVPDGDVWWRMLTYIPGDIYQSLPSQDHAFSAGKLVGAFHTALSDFKAPLVHTIPGFHDTPSVMKKLAHVYEKCRETAEGRALSQSIETVLGAYEQQPNLSHLPRRVIHGDLKISNVCFDAQTNEAVALIDLDTLMRHSIAVELGDALRSWCANGDEDTKDLSFNAAYCTAALHGYLSDAPFLTREERDSILDGIACITLELSARFLTDALEQTYFTHDASRYPSLCEQNKARGQNQLSLFADFARARNSIRI